MIKMKTNALTHEEIANRAKDIWSSRGSPAGFDNEIWFEAERQLTITSPEAAPAAGHLHGSAAPASSPDETAAKVAIQKSAARAPQHQHGSNAWKPAPPESGKPLWDQPHSS